MPSEQQLIELIQNEYARLKHAGADAQSAHRKYSNELDALLKQQLASTRAKAQQEQNSAAATRAQQLDALSKRFQTTQASIRGQIWNTTNTLGLVAAEWSAPAWRQFSSQTGHAVPTGMRVGLLKPTAPFKLPSTPALVSIIGNKHLLISFHKGLEDASNAMLQSAVLRLIAAFPAGAFRLTLVDAYGLGANLTAFLTLPEIIHTGHVFCNEREIEDELGNVSKHITNVIQTRLRYTFHTIEEYNQRVGEVSVVSL